MISRSVDRSDEWPWAAVAGLDPGSYGRSQQLLDSGVSKVDVDAVINLIAAVNAGVVQAIARRGYEQCKGGCPT